ncbi:dihydropteroate synthase [Rhodoligotrophos defluvii]|uniref:dihydropteroate synthase n=1 Tax=Rhodoligotrophos defluvii TaxID=2561934 RepID=UPI0010C96C24|nr:dihydropteroate synthase [Rhodoligotrophos defluvii]
MRLAGGPAAFSLVELIERAGASRRSAARMFPADEMARSTESTVRAILQALTTPRPAIAGLDFAWPLVMGIVNVTPDSFSDGNLFSQSQAAIDHARHLAEAGADILDIGGESTRPGADDVPEEEEARRVLPVVEGVRPLGLPVSIDTRKASVMRRAVAAGASIINDVSALQHDPGATAAVVETGAPVILMHAQGTPKTMQIDPRYDDVALDIFDVLARRIAEAEGAGIPRSRVIADPGIGFGKTHQHNLQLMAQLSLFHGLGVPLLLGASRKGFIGKVTGETEARSRVMGSVAAAMAGVQQGVQIVRVHDVRETVQSIAVWRRIIEADAAA